MSKALEIFILAGRIFEAHDFAKRVGLKKDNYTYVYDERSLQGRQGQVLLLVGSHPDRKDNQYIIDLAIARDFAVIRGED